MHAEAACQPIKTETTRLVSRMQKNTYADIAHMPMLLQGTRSHPRCPRSTLRIGCRDLSEMHHGERPNATSRSHLLATYATVAQELSAAWFSDYFYSTRDGSDDRDGSLAHSRDHRPPAAVHTPRSHESRDPIPNRDRTVHRDAVRVHRTHYLRAPEISERARDVRAAHRRVSQH